MNWNEQNMEVMRINFEGGQEQRSMDNDTDDDDDEGMLTAAAS